jgi:hypothetical protein
MITSLILFVLSVLCQPYEKKGDKKMGTVLFLIKQDRPLF